MPRWFDKSWRTWGSFLSHFLRPFTADDHVGFTVRVFRSFFFRLKMWKKIWWRIIFDLNCNKWHNNDIPRTHNSYLRLPIGMFLSHMFPVCQLNLSYQKMSRSQLIHRLILGPNTPPLEVRSKKITPKHQADLRFDPLAFQSYLLSFGVWLVWFLGSPPSYLLTWKVFGSLGDRHKKTRKKHVWRSLTFLAPWKSPCSNSVPSGSWIRKRKTFWGAIFFGNGVAVESLHHLRFSLKIHSETEWTMTTYSLIHHTNQPVQWILSIKTHGFLHMRWKGTVLPGNDFWVPIQPCGEDIYVYIFIYKY